MTNKVAFFYLHGTSPFVADFLTAVGDLFGQPRIGLLTVAGINGRTTTWPDGRPRDDPFINLLDPDIFEAKKIGYPAMFIPMGASMNVGITNLVNAINALPKGQKFMIGGYSQGAACASSVELMLRPGGSLHSSRGADYLGGVCFGNPRRQQDFRGEVGGTWSGAWDVPGSTTGGRGVFTATGPFPRLSGCDPTKWIEFTAPGDIFSSTGASTNGLGWSTATDYYLSLTNIPALLAAISGLAGVDQAFATGGIVKNMTDALGRVFSIGGNGHVTYPYEPPEGDPDNGLTGFQIAIKWLEGKAKAYAVSADVLPSTPNTVTNAGWTTTLIPPAA